MYNIGHYLLCAGFFFSSMNCGHNYASFPVCSFFMVDLSLQYAFFTNPSTFSNYAILCLSSAHLKDNIFLSLHSTLRSVFSLESLELAEHLIYNWPHISFFNDFCSSSILKCASKP